MTSTPPSTQNRTTPLSMDTLVVGGIELDIHGLAEVATDEVAVMFVAHGRMSDRTKMDKYCNILLETAHTNAGQQSAKSLVVVNFDQRNHGSRTVDSLSNKSFAPAGSSSDAGNDRHALDMYAIQTGTARDVSFLIDFLPAYLFPQGPRRITDFWMSGASLGGHATWLALRHDPRITLGIPIIGCADYLSLLSARAEGSSPPISTSSATHFPPALLALVATEDPVSVDYTSTDPSLNPYIGKKIFVISGTEDKLVPIDHSLTFFDGLNVGKEGRKERWMFEGGHELNEPSMRKAAQWVWAEGLSRI